jgi:hypothetical protein
MIVPRPTATSFLTFSHSVLIYHPIFQYYFLWRYTHQLGYIVEASRSHTFKTHTHTHTHGWTPLDEGSACRRDLYLTTHNIHKTQTSVSTAGFDIIKSEILETLLNQPTLKWNTHTNPRPFVCFDITKLFPDVSTVNTLQFKQQHVCHNCVFHRNV